MAAAALAERERIAKELEEEKKRLEMTTTELKSGLEVKATAYANIALTVGMEQGLAQKSEQLEKEKESVASMLVGASRRHRSV